MPVAVRRAKRPVPSAATPTQAGSRVRLFDRHPAPQIDDNHYNPLLGGISIAPRPAVPQRGTLGVISPDPGTGGGADVLLTNWHVLTARGTLPINSEIVQPGTSHLQTNVIGQGNRGHIGNVPIPINGVNVQFGIDAAVSSPLSRGSLVDQIVGLNGTVATGVNPFTGMQVEKRGIATVVTMGVINHVNQAQTVVHNGVTYQLDNQFAIQDTPQYPFFSDIGDSGSLVLTFSAAGPAWVGLLWGHAASLLPGRLTWACPSYPVQYYLAGSDFAGRRGNGGSVRKASVAPGDRVVVELIQAGPNESNNGPYGIRLRIMLNGLHPALLEQLNDPAPAAHTLPRQSPNASWPYAFGCRDSCVLPGPIVSTNLTHSAVGGETGLASVLCQLAWKSAIEHTSWP